MTTAVKIDPYATAFLDWLGCAAGGSRQPAARAARGTEDQVLALGTAGHVLDYDDTYAPGLAHLSAPTAPAALIVAADVDATSGEMLAAYAEGFEAMGALARASHPALYDGGWHPTAVCGVVGAAVAAARLLRTERETATAISLLRAGGMQAAFGSDGKALQVGMAASSGVTAARLAAQNASVPLASVARGPAGFERVFGGRFAEPSPADESAIERNWIKAWPCCLQTHSTIEAAERARASGAGAQPLEIAVHPVSLRAAAYGPRPADGLQAKFSIPYLAAYTLTHGAPRVESFEHVDADVVRMAEGIKVTPDAGLGESEAVLLLRGEEFRVTAALGSPERPMDMRAMGAKLDELAGPILAGALDDRSRPARELFTLLTRDAAGAPRPLPAFG